MVWFASYSSVNARSHASHTEDHISVKESVSSCNLMLSVKGAIKSGFDMSGMSLPSLRYLAWEYCSMQPQIFHLVLTRDRAGDRLLQVGVLR